MTDYYGSNSSRVFEVSVPNEIGALTEKVAPLGTDVLVIEDAADLYRKKKVQIVNLPFTSVDSTALHKATAGEIAVIAEKVAPLGTDFLVIEDHAAGDVKRRVQIGNLPFPASAGDVTGPAGATDGHLAMFDTATGKLLKDGGAPPTPYAHPNHSGDVTSVADGATTIAANAVTLAKLATQNAETVLANATAGAAVPTALALAEQTVLGRITGGHIVGLTAAEIRTLINVADGANAYAHPNHSGEVTSVGDGALTIGANQVTLAKLATQNAETVLANATAGAAVPTALALAEQTVLGRLTGGHVAALSVAQLQALVGATGGTPEFGDGSAGDVTIAGATALTADMFYNNLTVNAGQVLNPAGFIIRVLGTLTIAATGSISVSGGNGADGAASGVGGTGGTAAYSTSPHFNAPTPGGTGPTEANTGTNNGAAGGVPTPYFWGVSGVGLPCVELRPGCGGTSGASHGATGSNGVKSVPTVGYTRGGNGASATLTANCKLGGGGGGGGGGVIVIYANTIDNAGTISADGGAGGDGINSSTTKSGVGGGGSGGCVALFYRSTTGSGVGTLSAAAGARGSGTYGNTSSGSAGEAGTTITTAI
jgi:hypothetical protein